MLCQDCAASFEVIVVDDGSTDESVQIARSYPQITLVETEGNNGPGRARNLGLEIARGRYVAFLDADDVMLPDRLSLQSRLLDAEPSIVLAFGGVVFDGSPSELYLYGLRGEEGWNLIESPFDYLWGSGTEGAITSTVMLRRIDAVRVGGFLEKYRCGEDFDLWLRLSTEGSFAWWSRPIALMNSSLADIKLTKSDYVYLDGPRALMEAFRRDQAKMTPTIRRRALRSCRRSISMMFRRLLSNGRIDLLRAMNHAYRPELGFAFYLSWAGFAAVPQKNAVWGLQLARSAKLLFTR